MTDKSKFDVANISRRGFSAGTASLAAATLGMPSIVRAQTGPLKIGILLPRSGAQAQIGIDCQRGADLAKDILKGMGYPDCEFMLGDTETKVDVARAQAEKLINDGAHVIIGCFDSGQTLAAAQVCEQKNIPLIVNIGAAPQLTTQGYKWIFRNFPTGPMIVKDAFENQKVLFNATGKTPKTIAILHVNDAFGGPLAAAMEKLAPKFNMPYKIVEKIAYDPLARDLSAEVRKAKASKAEAVLTVSRLLDAIKLNREIVKQRWDMMGIINAGPGWYEYEFMKALGKYADDVVNLIPWFDAKKQLSQELEKAFLKKHTNLGSNMNTNHAYTFEGVLIALDAYKRAGSTKATDLQAALQKTDIKNNVTTGPGITFDKSGQNPNVKNSVVQNRGGKNLVIFPVEAAVTKPVWPMTPWSKRG